MLALMQNTDQWDKSQRKGIYTTGFVMETKAKLGAKAVGCKESENSKGYEIKEHQNPYNRVFDPEKYRLRLKIDHIWHVF